MLRKYSVSLSAIAILLTGSLMVFAQTAPVRGKVQLKKADGTTTPFAGAVIEVYRTDIKAKLPSGKSSKNGEFVFAGLPLGATMTLAISGPGIKAELAPGIKAGNEAVTITVVEGDGKALTEAEVRSALSTGPTQAQGGQETAEAKKAREEYEKQVAEAQAKNKKIEDTNKIVGEALNAGSKAFTDKNYDLAVAKFQEGIDADPDFAGSATVLNNNKALALRMRAFDSYRQSTTDTANKMSWMEKAKNDFAGSIAGSQRTLDIIAKITDSIEAAKYDSAKTSAIANLVEANRLMVATGADTSEAAANGAIKALEQYLPIEKDPAQKIKNQILVASALRLKVDPALAIPIYRAVLEVDPNNYEVMGYLGLCLVAVGTSIEPANKEQLQEGLNLMKAFVDKAPADKPGDKEYAEFKVSVASTMEYLKTQNLKPQSLPKPIPAKGKKP